MGKKTIVMCWILDAMVMLAMVGYYSAEKKCTAPKYLAAVALKRLAVTIDKDRCYLIYPWRDGQRYVYDIDNHLTLRPIAEKASGIQFDDSHHMTIAAPDDIMLAFLAGGIYESVKVSTKTAIKGGGNPKAKIIMLAVAVGSAITSYTGGEMLYRSINHPEFSEEMKNLLMREDFWQFLKQTTWYRLARAEHISREFPTNAIMSSDLLSLSNATIPNKP
jgi:hypothetical protein